MKEKKQSFNFLLGRLWINISRRRRVQFGFLFLIMIFASVAEVVSIGAVFPFLGVLTSPETVFRYKIVQPIIKLFNISSAKELLLPFTVVFITALIISGLIRFFLLWAQTRLGFAIGADLSFNMYKKTLYQPYAVHVSRNSSEVIASISSKANDITAQVLMPILTIFSSILMLLMILTALVTINPTIAIAACIGFGIIYFLIIQVAKKSIYRDSQLISRETNQVIKALQEGLGSIRDVLIDGTQDVYCKIYRDSDIPLRRAKASITIIGGSPRFGIEALGMALIALLAYSLTDSTDGGLSSTAIPVLGAMALGAQRMLPVLQLTYTSFTLIRGCEATLRETLDILDQPLPDYANQPLPKPISFDKSISLDKLSFRYHEDGPWVLNKVDLVIKKGSSVGFIGTTGSGKSTLLDVIMGLLQPVEGKILIDEIEIDIKNQRAWQSHIAHVPQAIFLSDASIIENIAFGVEKDKIDLERVKLAAEKAQLTSTIEALDKKYDTVVGERGVRLSGGQRQRIGIARALYKRADVIVFDEATSALDNETEKCVMEAIENLSNDITILIIAHRLSTLKNCNQIVELQDGKIKVVGTYVEMINK